MFYEDEKELHARFQKIKDNFFETLKEKMPVFNKGMWYLYILKL